jgi:hypothetical protein
MIDLPVTEAAADARPDSLDAALANFGAACAGPEDDLDALTPAFAAGLTAGFAFGLRTGLVLVLAAADCAALALILDLTIVRS